MDAEVFPQEVLTEDEPRYLRRQKPVEIRRRKFGKKAWKSYLRITVAVGATLATAAAVYALGAFLLVSPEMSLLHTDQVALAGNHYVTRANILEIFVADRGRSVLRIPLNARRKQIEALPWVEHAVVRRALPNRLQVEIIERTPVAFLRDDGDLALIDGHGVILDRPVEGNFQFPVITGIHPGLPAEERERRMQLFSGFLQQINSARSGASDAVSEIDLSDAKNIRATLDGLPANGGPILWPASAGPLVVDFGDHDFESRFQTLLKNIIQWRASAGRIESIDLRFDGEAVVNPGLSATAKPQPAAPARPNPAAAAKTKVSPPLAALKPPVRAKANAKPATNTKAKPAANAKAKAKAKTR
jgi:cell division protein FtsQ